MSNFVCKYQIKIMLGIAIAMILAISTSYLQLLIMSVVRKEEITLKLFNCLVNYRNLLGITYKSISITTYVHNIRPIIR